MDLPWPVWLSGWSVSLRYREIWVRFPLRARISVAVCPRPWLVVQVAATRCVPFTSMFLSLSLSVSLCLSLSLFLSLPPALSEQKMSSGEDKEKKKNRWTLDLYFHSPPQSNRMLFIDTNDFLKNHSTIP
uniref:Uncharacterized protein n=1 Tax=Molossus molossus TaxID=27622 RepID=A0A7J8ERC3_MOLMO|nr:hypothetical protein HJG59_008643 [Molossus molossus]